MPQGLLLLPRKSPACSVIVVLLLLLWLWLWLLLLLWLWLWLWLWLLLWLLLLSLSLSLSLSFFLLLLLLLLLLLHPQLSSQSRSGQTSSNRWCFHNFVSTLGANKHRKYRSFLHLGNPKASYLWCFHWKSNSRIFTVSTVFLASSA